VYGTFDDNSEINRRHSCAIVGKLDRIRQGHESGTSAHGGATHRCEPSTYLLLGGESFRGHRQREFASCWRSASSAPRGPRVLKNDFPPEPKVDCVVQCS